VSVSATRGKIAALRYEPPLDGIRAIAVLAVVLYHGIPRLAPSGGYVGVDMFFVLSGFLITRILLGEEASTGRISLPNFYMRRVLRLTPAFAAC
jgi:peptidoglycan/LPS O-acetylase OafA/YrhL